MENNFKKGFAAFYLTVLVLTTMMIMGVSFFVLFRNSADSAKNAVKSSQSFLMAESGLEDAIFRIKKNKQYQATYSFDLEPGPVSVIISSLGNTKTVKASGDSSQRIRVASAVLNIENTTISFHYGAQVDKGGLNMSNNTKVIGNVYSNGSISGSSLSSQITGDAWVAGSLSAQPDQQWTNRDSDFEFGLKKGAEYYLDTAQSFIPSISGKMSRVSLYLKKVGSPPNQTIRVLADNNGRPGKTVLGSGTLVSSRVTSVYSWADVSFDTQPTLAIGQVYWLAIDVSRDDGNYWVWGRDSSNNYASGSGKYTRDWSAEEVVWKSAAGDLDFKTFMGGEDPTFIKNIFVGVDAHANQIQQSSIARNAYFQTIDEATQVGGVKYQGAEDPPVKDLPISLAQIQEWEAAAAAGSLIQGDYYPQPGSLLGPVKIEGDLIFPGNSLNNPVIISGPVWVEGDISSSNNSKIKLQGDAGSGFAIIADDPSDQEGRGRISLYNNAVTEDSVSGYLLLISTNKSMDPADPAILISNNVNADNPASIVFSLQGLIKVQNNAKFKEVSGYGLKLENNAEIVYEEGLIDSNFSAGPGSGWTVRDWQETK